MAARVLFVLVAFGLASTMAADTEEDPFDSIEVKEVRPGSPGSNSNSLEIQCRFDKSKTDFANVYKLGLVRSDVYKEVMAEVMGAMARSKSYNYLGESVASVSGKLDDNGVSSVDMTYVSKDEGYCRKYMCIAIGLNAQHKQISYSKEFKVETVEGSSCVIKQIQELSGRVDQCCEASEQVDKNSALLQTLTQKMDGLSALPGKAQEQSQELESLAEQVSALSGKQENVESNTEDIKALQEQVSALTQTMSGVVQSNEEGEQKIELLKTAVETLAYALGKYLRINTNKYDVSGLYNDHIYIASKDEPKFYLAEMNELCAEYSGYLAEIDDDDEEKFLEEFTTSIGKYKFAIGANDVDNEGEFVYYNSKKPVPDSLWLKNQPSNSWGIENCAEILKGGLNDIKCPQNMRYVCEIPLE